MSSDAVGWTYRHSPYRGATFAVHQAVADSVNDQNSNEFWMAKPKLAAKARCGRGSAIEAVARLVADGFLELIHESPGRAPSHYRFLFPDVPVVYESRGQPSGERTVRPAGPTARSGGPTARPADGQPRGERALTQGVTQENPNEPNGGLVPVPGEVYPLNFETFWQLCPRKEGKGAAERAWNKATRRTAPEVIVAGMMAYAAHVRQVGIEPQFIPHPATWLNGRRWEDDDLPPAPSPGNGKPPNGRPPSAHAVLRRMAGHE